MSLDIKISTRYEKRQSDGFRFSAASRVKQEFSDDSDINNLVSRFRKTGVFATGQVSQAKAFYGDFTTAADYQSALNATLDVEARFASLSADNRAKFRNRPELLLEYLENPDNQQEAQELGIISSPPRHIVPLDVNVPDDTLSSPPVQDGKTSVAS